MINEEPEYFSEQDLSEGELVDQEPLEAVEDPAVRLAGVITRSRISATTDTIVFIVARRRRARLTTPLFRTWLRRRLRIMARSGLSFRTAFCFAAGPKARSGRNLSASTGTENLFEPFSRYLM